MPSPSRPLRVALDVRIPAGQWGGIQQMAEGLARGLGALGGDDEFVFIGFEDAAAWLDPLLTGRCRRVVVPRSHGRSMRRRLYDSLVTRAPAAGRLAATVGHRLGRVATPISRSDGLLESLGVDAVHFVTPQAYLTSIPSVYQVMDLLHEHLPELFSPLHRRYRREAYRVFADQAVLISTMAEWTRADLAARMALPRSKVAVVPIPPAVTPATIQPERPRDFEMPAVPFLLYPAQTWAHKNHVTLIDAIGLLRDQQVAISLICTGKLTEHHRVIERHVEELGLGDQVRFLGYVEQSNIAWLYQHAAALVFPSRFEGWGIPVVEAFAWDLPVACSSIPVLQEAAQEGALLFDPLDPAGMANAIRRVVEDEGIRERLVAAGRRRLDGLSWDRAARTFCALYRRAADHPEAEEDVALLAPPTLVS
jgi:glycosyltransferase involved in cell wall biosynthesis